MMEAMHNLGNAGKTKSTPAKAPRKCDGGDEASKRKVQKVEVHEHSSADEEEEHDEHFPPPPPQPSHPEQQPILEPEPSPPPAPPPDVADDDSHRYWWLTRIGRQATCGGCRLVINSHSFRVCFCRNPRDVEDVRRWQMVWQEYFHVDRKCLPCGRRPRLSENRLIADAAFLPKKSGETVEQYRESVAEAKKKLFEEYEAGLAKSGRSHV